MSRLERDRPGCSQFTTLPAKTLVLQLAVLAASLLLSQATTASAQTSSSPVTKAEAIRTVRVSSLPGWFEFLSEQCRFRVLFPGAPRTGVVASSKGFKLRNGSDQWAARCGDLDVSAPNETSLLRQKYQEVIAAMTRGDNRLFASGDVMLNGRLGAEVIIQRSSRIDYVRTFAYGRRVYTLTVTRKRTNPVRDGVPPDVQTFFDSFTYWD